MSNAAKPTCCNGWAFSCPPSEPQLQLPQPFNRLLHQRIFFGLVLRQVGHREAQVRPRVVPGHAADRLLGDEEMRHLFRGGEGMRATALAVWGDKEIRPA